MTEDPLVAPTTPGAAFERLLHVSSVFYRDVPELREIGETHFHPLEEASEMLLVALRVADQQRTRTAFEYAQIVLRRLYETLCQPGILPPETAPQIFAALRFPDPHATGVAAVDVSTVFVTHSKPFKQVLTTIAFSDAPGAVGYRLREIRYLRGEELSDDTVASYQPQFRRVRLPIGEHHFRIESRDQSVIAVSEQFTIQVPPL